VNYKHYLVFILLTFLLIITVAPVAAKYPISINPSSVTRVKQSNTLLEGGKQFYDEGKLIQASFNIF